MSGPYPINVARSLFIPRPCGLELKPSATSALEASSLDEKQGLYENEKTEVVNGSTKQASLSFSREAITKALDDLVAYAKLLLTFPSVRKSGLALFKEVYLPQRKTLSTQPELAVLKAAAVEITLPVAEANPLTAQRIKELLVLFPEAYGLLEAGQHLLTGTTAEGKKEVNQLFRQYAQQLKPLENIIWKAWSQAVGQEKLSISNSSFSAFTDRQVDTLTEIVNSISTFVDQIKQSSKSLGEAPKLRNFRFWCGLVGIIGGIVAGSLTLSICLGCAVVPIAPICISLSIGILSGLAYIGSHLYENNLSAKAQEWNTLMDDLANFTEQLKHFKDSAMTSNISVHGARIDRLEPVVTQIDTKQQSQAQELKEVKAENQKLLEMVFSLQARVDAMEKNNSKTAEGQKTAGSASQQADMPHFC